MKPERWRRVEELYHCAIELQGEVRATYLDQACGEDKPLRKK